MKQTEQTSNSSIKGEHETLDIEPTKDGKLMIKILSWHSHSTSIEYLIDSGACFNALSFNSAKQLGQIDYSDKSIG